MKKRFLALFIVVVMLLSQATIFATDLDISSASASENPEDKLTDELKEVMSNTPDDEYISIYIWLKVYSDESVYYLLSRELGENITKETEDDYINSQVGLKVEKVMESEKIATEQKSQALEKELTNKQKAQKLIETANISDVMLESEIERCIETGMSNEEIVNIAERTEYLSKWREKRELLNSSINSVFEAKIDEQNCKNIYIDSKLSYITMECKKSYINTISRCEEVDEIGCLIEATAVLDSEDGTYSSNNDFGYHMTEKEGISYNAAGIKIGVIELAKEYSLGEYTYLKVNYDIHNPHLSNKSNNQLIVNKSFIDSRNKYIVQSDHADTVLSIISGDEAMSADGVTYKGIAPNATVYYTMYNCDKGFEKTIADRKSVV